MPSIELSKLQGITGARALSESDRSRAENSAPTRPDPARSEGAKPGIALEVGTSVNAAEAPVNSDRVAQIREALKDGTYPLVPAKIADAMIAARVGFALEKQG